MTEPNAEASSLGLDPHDIALNKEAAIAGWVAVFAVLVMFCYFFYFILVRKGMVPGGPDSWGQFGDFFGGVINPIVGIATVILVVRTLKTTRAEARDTRQQLEIQTTLLQAQVANQDRAQQLAEVQKRLDGALGDWQTQMDLRSPYLIRLRNGEPVSEAVDLTSRELLYDMRLLSELQSLGKHPSVGALAKQTWHDAYRTAIGILWELRDYAAEYDQISGDRKLTDYYRRRVQLPLRALHALGVVSNELHGGLQVGIRDMAFAQG